MPRRKKGLFLTALLWGVELAPTLAGAAVAMFWGALMAGIIGGMMAMTTGEVMAQKPVKWVDPSLRTAAWYFHTYSDALRDQPLRALEMLIGLMAGGIAGGCLAYQGKGHKEYALGLFARVALVASGLPLMRLADHQNHWPTAAVFWLLGSVLFLVGWWLVIDVVMQTPGLAERLPRLASLTRRVASAGVLRLLTFAPIGAALIAFGAYFSGGVELACKRVTPQQVDCVLEEYRWLGQVHVRTTLLQGLREARMDNGVVLVADSGDVYIQGHMNELYGEVGSLNEFLESTRPALRVRSEPRFVFFGFCLVAAVLVLAGFASDPVTAPVSDYAPPRHWIQVFESRLLVAGGVLCLFGAATFLVVVPAVQSGITEDDAPLLNAITMASAPDGLEAFVEGRVSGSNALVFNDFVMYQLQQHRGDNWISQSHVTPPFAIDVAGAGAEALPVQVGNDNYAIDAFSNAPVEFRPAEPSDGGPLRYRGFVRGSAVTAYGEVTRASGGPQFRAWWLFGDTYQEYVRQGYGKLKLMKGAGVVFTVVGIALLAAFVRRLFTTPKKRTAQ